MNFVDQEDASEELPEEFEPYVKEWFNSKFESLSPPQKFSFDLIHENKNSLICAPTGSGKTLSAFMSGLNELFMMGDEGELDDEVYVLYISPLRALGNDIERNLEEPLDGIKERAEEMGYDVPEVRSAVRTGDTTDAEKSKMLDKPPHILITTPETLGILINSPKFKEKLKNVKYTIIDEIHSISENKRGVHLSLSMERLQEMANNDFTRIGLSATQAPIDEIAKYLVGYDVEEDTSTTVTEYDEEIKAAEPAEEGEYDTRGCNIVDVAASKEIDLETVSPVKDLINEDPGIVNEAMYDKIHNLAQNHESTIIFTNTRSATERVVNNLKDRFPDHYNENIGAHHSSMSREKRLEVEEKLKKGEMKVGVTSTSLELGVDIGSVDLVIQIGSPKGVARGIQRVGRSGHQIGEKAKGKMIVNDRDDALECSVLTKCAKEDELDRIQIPENALDVLAQHMVGMACNHKWDLDHAFNVIRKSYCYRTLSRNNYDDVLKYLGGEYELEDQNVYRKIWIDRDENLLGRSGKMTRVIYMTNIGTIPDETGYDVKTRGEGNYVGTLDEEFLDRLTKGDIFTLGGSTYKFSYAKGMKVFVDPKPNASPTVPSWYSERLPLSYDLGVKIGEFRKQVADQLELGAGDDDIIQWIMHNYYLDENTAEAIYRYIKQQKQFLGKVSTHEDITVEKHIDEDNRQNFIFHTIYGRRTHDAMARIMAHLLQKRVSSNIGMVIDDNGFILITPRRPIDIEKLMDELASCDLEEELKDAVGKTELMKRRFRHVAGRSLMILRNYGGNSKTVGQQQMKGHFLLSTIRNEHSEDFPMVKETYREIMEDAMDIKHTKEVVEKIDGGDISFEVIDSDIPSPFSHNLLLQGSTDVVKMEDKKERLQNLHEQVMERIEEK
ncbi:MAG: ATP-dependent helicase [Nanohaloarchaea archaeon]|nr:ATP-dependent helicase [Candidatus Nanohaloarchaea archaeon]